MRRPGWSSSGRGAPIDGHATSLLSGRFGYPQRRHPMRLPGRSYVSLERKVEELTRELRRARDREATISEVLRVISGSQADVQPVLDTIAERAAILCDAQYVALRLIEGDKLRRISVRSREGESPAAESEVLLPINRDGVSGRAVLERRTVHIEDIVPLLDTEYPGAREHQPRPDVRTMLAIPLVRDGNAIGTICLWGREPRLFSNEQVALVQTFADQAAMAIENIRLSRELQARNRDLTESLDQQTATAEILKVISSSPTDTQPVFDAIAKSAARLCDTAYAGVFRFDGEHVTVGGQLSCTQEAREALQRQFPMPADHRTAFGKAILTRAVVHTPNIGVDRAFSEVQRLAGYRSVLAVPMLRDGSVAGAISVLRCKVGPFSDSQIALLKTFADQAVIAIDNARLFRETKEALEQQTATAEILRVISTSPTDVQPV